MKALHSLPVLLAFFVSTPEMRYFRYQRPVHLPAASDGQACLVADAALFAQTTAGLADLRLYSNGSEEPYLIHEATPPQLEQQVLRPMNAGTRGNLTVFDVEMPAGRYESVDLSLAGQDFVATVKVEGSQSESGARTRIGSYTVFDLTHQKLGRGTVLSLPVSDYRYLHFSISGPIKAENVQGIRVSRASEGEARFVEVTRTGPGTMHDRSTVLTAKVPANTPVDRIVFVPGPATQPFERTVHVTAKPEKLTADRPAWEDTVADGSLLRIHGTRQGQRIDEERLEIAVPPRQRAETSVWTISIDNGDDRPLPIESARLEMVERDLCFNARPGASFALFYGDYTVNAPRYDYASLTEVQAHPVVAELGPETANPSFQPRPDARPLTEKHPSLLWAALIGVIGLLGWLTLRTARKRNESTPSS